MRHKINRTLLLILLMLQCRAAYASSLRSDNIQHSGLSAEQAQSVLVVVLKHLRFNLSKDGMYIEGPLTDVNGKPFRVGYYDFSLSFDSVEAGATDVLGHYTVNAMTGDVWETERCIRYHFSSLSKIQHIITKRTGKKISSELIARREIGC